MIVIGAGGHAKEVIEILCQNKMDNTVLFYDDVTKDKSLFLEKYPIISTEKEVLEHNKKDARFITALSGTAKKEKIVKQFINLGGIYDSVIASNAIIGQFDVLLGTGLNIMQNVFISNNVKIGEGTLINYGASLHHDCSVGRFCEISPQAQLLGGVVINDYVSIGAGAIILPKIKIGSNSVIGAGCVVTKDVPDNVIIVGVPGRIIEKSVN